MTVIMSIIAVCFVVMAISMIVIATIVRRIVGTVNRLEEKVEPLILKVNVLSDQGKLIAATGKRDRGTIQLSFRSSFDSNHAFSGVSQFDRG